MIIQLEEELKYKIQEVARQLTHKEEEILNIKMKFKEERQNLEMDKKRLAKEVADCHLLVQQAQTKFYALKSEVEESPLQVLRTELGQKQLELVEMQTKVKTANSVAEEFKLKFEQLKKDMVMLKRKIDQDKELQLLKQAEEIEQLKQMMRVKQAQDEERSQFEGLRQQLGALKSNLSRAAEKPANVASKAVKEDRTILLDDFASNYRSPPKQSGQFERQSVQ